MKDAKKLVSKCIYINILKVNSTKEVLEKLVNVMVSLFYSLCVTCRVAGSLPTITYCVKFVLIWLWVKIAEPDLASYDL